MIRQAAVAGQFYPAISEQLRAELSLYIDDSTERIPVIGIVAPHAGYIYSGKVAGAVYGAIEIPRQIVILCPNHHGVGTPAAISPAEGWATPLGTVPIAQELRQSMLAQAPALLAYDSLAHLYEHSLEVQLPFIQTLRPDAEIVPIALGFGDYASCEQLGNALAKAIAAHHEPVLIVASSDMTHYETAAEAKRKDEQAIRHFLDLDPAGLLQVCRSQAITMCGVVPATVLLVAAKALGATRAALVSYATSGDVTGDYRQVVAYAALTVA